MPIFYAPQYRSFYSAPVVLKYMAYDKIKYSNTNLVQTSL
jgi:hypothetical protein